MKAFSFLCSVYRGDGVSYCYVTLQPHPGLDKFVTSTLECNTHRTVWETQTQTHIPLKFLSKQVSKQNIHKGIPLYGTVAIFGVVWRTTVSLMV